MNVSNNNNEIYRCYKEAKEGTLQSFHKVEIMFLGEVSHLDKTRPTILVLCYIRLSSNCYLLHYYY